MTTTSDGQWFEQGTEGTDRMRPDEAGPVAKGDRTATDAPSEDLEQHRLACAREIVRAYRSSHPTSGSEDPDLTSKVLTMLEELASWTPSS